MTSSTVVIAFLARAGSGKSMAAKHLIHRHGAARVSFAGPLKELAKRLLDLSEDQVYGHLKETLDDRYGMTPRVFLQRLGNEARDIIGPRVWIDAALNAIERTSNRLVVIDDCRYVNEAEAIASLTNGHVIKIESPDRDSQADPNHPSEAEVDKVPDRFLSGILVNKQEYGPTPFLSALDGLVGELLRVFPGRLRG